MKTTFGLVAGLVLSTSVLAQSYTQAMNSMYKLHNSVLSSSTTLYGIYSLKDAVLSTESARYPSASNAEQILHWDHVVSVRRITTGQPCWDEGGRGRCARSDSPIAFCLSDMHNLYPAASGINQMKGGRRIGLELLESPKVSKGKFFITKESAGQVARAHLYMGNIGCVSLTKEESSTFFKWSKLYPPTNEEYLRDTYINTIQGNHNPYITVWHRTL